MAYVPTSTFSYSAKTQHDESLKENLGQISLQFNGDTDTQLANAQKLDAFGRAVAGLTTNTFISSEVTSVYNIQDIIDELG